jgi:NADH-quinone oxidoreductase subunit D
MLEQSLQNKLWPGFTGPNLRAAGVDYDVRVAQPYSSYEDFEFNASRKIRDTYDRFVFVL